MKLEDHVENIRLKVESAVRNTLDRFGITENNCEYHEASAPEVRVGNVSQLIESIQSEKKEWQDTYCEVVDEYAFTLFNRLICMKVLETHGLYPEMITKRQQHSDRSYAHYMWLEENSEYRDTSIEGLASFIEWQFMQLETECELFKTDIPLHMIPTSIALKEIMDAINSVDADVQIVDCIWIKGNILSQIYEIYNNTKKAALKASGEKVEYNKVHIQSQIYTPDWVVKFLVDNSLGKLYIEMYPDSSLKNTHKIIGKFDEVGRERKPLDKIKVIDPCVGSGNFLLYCYDLFYEMYMDQIDNYGADYSKREVQSLIIEKNLYGIDLDERAVQLTKVGLFIKAKTKKNNVKIEHFNVVSASFYLPSFEQAEFIFDSKFFSKDFSELVADVWSDLQQAHKFGSLLRIDEKYAEKRKEWNSELQAPQLSFFTYEKAAELDAFDVGFYKELEKAVAEYAVDDKRKYWADEASIALTYLRIMLERYDVVVSNPPYTDSAALGNEMHSFLEDNYKKPYNCTTNLYACFIYRNLGLIYEDGYIAMIHPHTFMNIDTFKDIRKFILDKAHIDILVDYGLDRVNLFGPGILLDAVWHITQKCKNNTESLYFNISDNQQEKYKKQSFIQAVEDVIFGTENVRISTANQNEFRLIEGTPLIFNLSPYLRKHFSDMSLEKAGIKVVQGLATSSNERFVRLWWEISEKKIYPVNDKWFSYSKGGPFCKWYGNNWAVVNWENDGKEIKGIKDESGKQKSRPQNEGFYKKRGITYTGSGSKGTSFRLQLENSLFDVGGSCVFPTGSYGNLEYIIAFLNSRLSFYLIDCLNPTVNTQVGDLKRVPFVKPDKTTENIVATLSKECIEYKKKVDILYMLNGADKSPLSISTSISEAILNCIQDEILLYCKILMNEAVIDRYICELYELNNNDMKCMTDKMGECVANLPVYRKAVELFYEECYCGSDLYKAYFDNLEQVNYSLEQLDEIETLIRNVLYQKNNEIEDFCSLNTINPITVWYLMKMKKINSSIKAKQLAFEWMMFSIKDLLNESEDGIISLCDTDTSILSLLEEYADSHGLTSAQLLQFEEFLGKKLKIYCEQDFFMDLMNYTNVFMYLPKTPFVWHLSSGESKGFEAYILIYKWNRDSIFKLKSKYIGKRRERLEFRRTQLADTKTAQVLSEKELIEKQLKEIRDFSAKLDELIAQGYDPKLDDGVGKNIAPLQEKRMLKVDVLNPNQLKKYLKVGW